MISLSKLLTLSRNAVIIASLTIFMGFTPKSNWSTYFINPLNQDGKTGTIELFQSNKGHLFNKINLLILNNSAWILNDKEKLNTGSEMAMRKLFTRQNPTSDLAEPGRESINGAVSFSFNNLLCYKVRLDTDNDKGSPYIEYLNIDLYSKRMITINDVIDSTKAVAFKTFFQKYATSHKKEMITKYKQIIAERADQLLANELEVFDKPTYTYQKVILKSNVAPGLLSIRKDGIEINTEVSDMNFDGGRTISSSVLLPYTLLEPFLNSKSTCSKAFKILSVR